MKLTQFVETTRERYEAHVHEYQKLTTYGGRTDFHATDIGDELTQVKLYHNPRISDIGLTPEWALVAMGIYNRFHPEHSQYFILEEVTMGVTTKQIGLNGQEEK